MASVFTSVLLGVAVVQASPTLVSRQSVTSLSTSQVDSFDVYTRFAGAAYCPSDVIQSWTCGVNCGNNSDFKPVATGGNGDSVQYWYAGYSPSLDTVIMAHQGTDPSQIKSILTDLGVSRGKLDSTLFPGISSDIEVHQGFRDDHAKTASDVLSAVQKAMSGYKTSSVTMVGHSLGAALSLLDSVYLPLHLPAGTTFRTILYGLPRVGNQPFADYVDANLHVTHIGNMKDPIPVLPPMLFGYVQTSGEVHITENGQWEQCPGDDNRSSSCSRGDVSDPFSGQLNDHDGPYNGIKMGCHAGLGS